MAWDFQTITGLVSILAFTVAGVILIVGLMER
jgi:hypothetical protein